ncbi:hypothetical protein JK636_11255 [Clostridium sp. YIM B02515]|uniref:Uncharacterized protein n=1 Tax=Clostridium rhizosphaerae TaxID=2803861 RepID=A0ABS1TEE2_9CLOT|nr:hypothetical protein [Clostridium rhizosphaerae]MBL4936338.1 hypothetical protein [Clostridium rhizosphaerae]
MIDKLLIYAILLLPIMHAYQFLNFPVSIGEVFLLMAFIIYLLKNKIKFENNTINSINRGNILFLLFALLTLIFYKIAGTNYFDSIEFIKSFIRLAYHSILLIFLFKRIDSKKFFDIYTKLATIFTLYLFLQLVLHYIFAKDIGAITIKNKMWIEQASLYASGILYRPASLFLESSWYAIYLAPILAFNLIIKCNLKVSILLTLGLVLSTSNFGFIFTFVCWGYYFIINITKINRIIIGSIPIIIAIVVLPKIQLISDTIYRLKSLGSLNGRFLAGVDIYKQLPLIKKIFGVGFANVQNYTTYNFLDIHLSERAEYMSTLIYLLCTFGIIGLILYLRYFCNYLKYLSKRSYIFLILTFLLLLFDSAMLMPQYVVYFMTLNMSVLLDKKIMVLD